MRRQRGAALILTVTVLVLGIAWFGIGALGKAAPTTAERENKTGLALQAAKQAVLSYAAQYAARSDQDVPGRLPCPEHVNWIGTANEGTAWSTCVHATGYVGRLPWRTLGIDQLRDGYGEPLWYVLGPGFRDAPINFGSTGQLTYNGAANAAVALIIAPGVPLQAGGCNTVNQQVAARNAAPLDPTRFLECGNTSANYATGSSSWNNDRVVAITAAEWADAIAPAIADRLQRQVAPALADWESAEAAATGKSWSSSWGRPYLPFATTFANPTTSTYCGNAGEREGLAPVAPSSVASCDTRWTGNAGALLNLISLGCSQQAAYLSCQFFGMLAIGGATITATAPNIATGFRGTVVPADITVTGGGSVGATSMTISSVTGAATLTAQVTFPVLGLLQLVEVRVPYVGNAAVLSDTRVTWVTNNNWQRYMYYAIGQGATVNPPMACAAAGDPGCITVTGLAASTGNTNDKRLMLALTGRALSTQTQPSANRTDYLESRVSSSQFTSATVTSTYNDRLAVCPFRFTMHDASTTTICN